jgi:hypothetical protein
LTGIGGGLGFHKKKGWGVYDEPWEKTSVENFAEGQASQKSGDITVAPALLRG